MNYAEFRKRYQWNAKIDKLGEGGFGKVYRALDTARNRLVVLKIADVPTDHKFSLQREVELNRDLTPHPNIAQYRNCYRLEDDHGDARDYATMDYFPDGSLTNVMNRPIDPDELRDIVTGMLQGLAHLEREQVIHRDFKPGNVLMARDDRGRWQPKIADFGLSRFTDMDTTVSNSSIGISYDYAAPEQFQPGSVNRQADLWALGVIVYRLCTGKLPFVVSADLTGESRRIELTRLINQAKLPADVVYIVEPYQTMVRQCLIKELNERVSSACDLLDLLNKLSDHPYSVVPWSKDPETEVESKPVLIPLENQGRLVPQQSDAYNVVDSSPRTVDTVEERESFFKQNKSLILIAIGCIFLLIMYFVWQRQTTQKDDKLANTLTSGAFGDYSVPESVLPPPPDVSRTVNDYVAILSTSERNRLEEKIQTYNDAGPVQLVLVIVNSTSPYSIKDYAVSLGNNWRVGSSDKKDGLVILWATAEKKVFIATSHRTNTILSDLVVKDIIDQIIIPNFSRKRYYLGLRQAVDAIAKRTRGKQTIMATESAKPETSVSRTNLSKPSSKKTDATTSTPADNTPIPSAKEPREEVERKVESQSEEQAVSSEEIFTVVEQQPEFPGGMAALGQYLSSNLRYPETARQANVSGRVFVSFVVNTDGSVQDVKVLKGLGFGTDEEAQRLLRSMPKWRPGRHSGRPVRVKYNLPISFNLE